jgi:4-amino-4-deoxy-L-arabinose transferase-like glycosyltransferase
MTSRHSQNIRRWSILAAIMVGFGLRIYDLDGDSLWNDEAGQALAAMQPTILDTLHYIKGHAGAMPMDYLITRLFIQLSTNEFVLRLPALFWSTASIALLVALAKRMAGRDVAIVAVWFMAFAPQLVYYAQEVRPYAALLFFLSLQPTCFCVP